MLPYHPCDKIILGGVIHTVVEKISFKLSREGGVLIINRVISYHWGVLRGFLVSLRPVYSCMILYHVLLIGVWLRGERSNQDLFCSEKIL